jgi:2,4-dienoyl-CoA reductase-like NADH-dependent reductase (Old Yellow Enzyme family)
MPHLLDPLKIRGVTFRNRVGISPMCMYSSDDGMPNDWHLMHLGARAAGGSGLTITEASAVEPRGRITPRDAGLWNDSQAQAWSRIVRFAQAQGAKIGTQLAHAGRKASTDVPWSGGKPLTDDRAWQTVAPSALPFDEGWHVPSAMDAAAIHGIIDAFARSAQLAVSAGFDFVEVHGAHGYLLHEFYSPLSNRREDEYGGSFAGRTKLLREIARRVRSVIPDAMPMFVRLSCTDWVEGGWTTQESVELSRQLKALGTDVIDCSSAANVPRAQISVGPGYQVPFARQIRAEAGIATAAVGMITAAEQANAIIEGGDADVVLLARASLRDPNFAIRAANDLGRDTAPLVPNQYARSW